MLTSCGDTEYEYSGNSAYFVFENTASRSAALASAMNNMSPGIFCRITLSVDGNHFNFSNNHGLSDDPVAMSAVDKQRTVRLGVYNMTGIIVGYGNLNNPPTFYAYDSLCPNCYKDTGAFKSLAMHTDGTAECGSCHRKYDMNNGGIVVAGDGGDKMMRYHASTTGPEGVLVVTN